MKKYDLTVYFSDGTTEGDTYDTMQEAEDAEFEWRNFWHAGADALKLAGEPYSDAEIVDIVIKEIDED